VQFGAFVGNALQGEFGMSLRQGRKVSSLIMERLPATLELSLAAALIALLVGIPLGVYAALRRGRAGAGHDGAVAAGRVAADLPDRHLPDPAVRGAAEVAAQLRPGRHREPGRLDTGLLTADGWKHLVLPAITLSVYQLALIMRLVRAEMLEVLRTDFIKFAKARGPVRPGPSTSATR
jgi:peptide/nickel transport system permease protein